MYNKLATSLVQMKKDLLTCILFLFCSFHIAAQCSGNLGENIFTAGDFGSGTANIPSQDPGIAPGYTYTTSPPPEDGSYTITNNTSSWGSFASNWADIGDNSNDPNGYMMVVNASFTPGLFYEQEVTGLCENTLYVFSADIYNIIAGAEWIKPNVSFLIDGNTTFETGEIPDNNEWITYGFTFTTQPGQTSVTLALANNAPGGNGNDLALDNITFRPCGPEALILPATVANICEEGEPLLLEATINGNQYPTPTVQWQQSPDGNTNWTDIPGATNLSFSFDNVVAGTYYYRYLLANDPDNLANSRCRVISNIKTVNVVPKFYTRNDTICEGLSLEVNGNIYNQSGTYVDSMMTVLGCDSIVTLNLTVIDDPGLVANFSLTPPGCSGGASGMISLDTVLNGTAPYQIFVNDVASADGDLSNLAEGDYHYSITDRYGCSLDTTFQLSDPEALRIEAGADQTVNLGEVVRLNAVITAAVDTLFWTAIDTINCNGDCTTANFLPTRTQTVLLSAVGSRAGCLVTDSLTIRLISSRQVFVPNAFSPNGDGVNDVFTIFGGQPNVQMVESLQVFNRWGQLLKESTSFSPNDLNAGWDGRINNEFAEQGTYIYLAKVRFLDGHIATYSGSVSLLR